MTCWGVDPRSSSARRADRVRPTLSLTRVCVCFCLWQGLAPGQRPARRRGWISANFGDGGSGRVALVPALVVGRCCKWYGGIHPGGSTSRHCGTCMSTPPLRRRRAKAGSSLGQPIPAHRCCQAGISADALRALTTALKLASTRRPYRRVAGIGPRRAKTLGCSATAERCRACARALAATAAKRAYVQTQRNV